MKNFTCIICPNGCHLNVNENTLSVAGNKCARGQDFAIKEIKNPERTISSTVKTIFDNIPVVPVKVSKEIPKSKIFEVIQEINNVVLDHPVNIGDVIIKDVCGLEGIDVVVISNLFESNNVVENEEC